MTDLPALFDAYLAAALDARRLVARCAPFAPPTSPPALAVKCLLQGNARSYVPKHSHPHLRDLGWKRTDSAHARLAREQAKHDWATGKPDALCRLEKAGEAMLARIFAGPRFRKETASITLHTLVTHTGVWGRLALRDRSAFHLDQAVPLDTHPAALARLWQHAALYAPRPTDTAWRVEAYLYPADPNGQAADDEEDLSLDHQIQASDLEGALMETALTGANSLLLPGRIEHIHVLKELDPTEKTWLETWHARPNA